VLSRATDDVSTRISWRASDESRRDGGRIFAVSIGGLCLAESTSPGDVTGTRW
jgi:hypothetical protein